MTLVPTTSDSTPPATPELRGYSQLLEELDFCNLTPEEKARIAVVEAFVANATQFAEKYLIRGVIGFGSNGVVLSGQDLSTKATVAVKIIYKRNPGGKLTSKAKPAEIESLKSITKSESCSPYLLKYIADWDDEHHYYLVTNVHGSNWLQTLGKNTQFLAPLAPLTFPITSGGATVIQSLPMSSGSADLWSWSCVHRIHIFQAEGHKLIPMDPIKRFIKQTAMALSYVHSKAFYHGDVKLENILVQYPSCPKGQGVTFEGSTVCLADFGHARPIYEGIFSYGTRAVSPPELLKDSPYEGDELDGRSADVFALGMVLYLLLTENGELPTIVKCLKANAMGWNGLVKIGKNNGKHFPLDRIPDLEESAWDLLNGMTCIDPEERLAIDDVVSHPWMKNDCDDQRQPLAMDSDHPCSPRAHNNDLQLDTSIQSPQVQIYLPLNQRLAHV
ncbi:kinase-like domain-containing protein [Obelidium mucronatum]|nr:kinase-like domain-containing protein [Obelidium mucronatum]